MKPKRPEPAHQAFEKGHDLAFVTQWLFIEKPLRLSGHRERFGVGRAHGKRKSGREKQAGQAHNSVLDLGFHFLQRGVEEIARSEFPKILLDVLVVRLSKASEFSNLPELLESLKSGSVVGSPLAGNPKTEEGRQKTEAGKKNPAPLPTQGKLKDFIQQVSSKRPQIGSLLAHIKAAVLSGEVIYFQLDAGGIWMDLLSERKAQIEEIAGAHFARPLRVVIQEGPLPAGEETAQMEAGGPPLGIRSIPSFIRP